MTVSYSTGRYPFPFHRKNWSAVLEQLKLILFSVSRNRIVPNFLVQTGDRTGTGGGGESIYGGAYRIIYVVPWISVYAWAISTEPFEDEVHPRLRFPHRGLVACANDGTKNSNDSQFFITLGSFVWFRHCFLSPTPSKDRAEELHGKHTLFGRCVGDTIYSTS